MKKIILSLNEESIRKAIGEVEAYKQDLRQGMEKLIIALVEQGTQIAKAQVRDLGAFYTGELEASIRGYYSPSARAGVIKAGAWYAIYVEYGTGVVGSRNPHPLPEGWVYDVNSHGEAGWKYFNDRDGRVHWTQGMPSRPFMYNTAKELERLCGQIAREVFGR